MSKEYSSTSNGNQTKGADSDPEEDKRDSILYWLKWEKAARENKYAKEHRLNARDAWDEYERRGGIPGESGNYKRCYPVWWSSSKTVEAAYFGRVPQSGAKRREGVGDAPALLAATLAKRLGEHALEISDFETAMGKSVQELIQADKCTMQLCYDAEKTKTRVPLSQDMALPEGVEVQQDEAGNYFYEAEEVIEETQKLYLKAVMYDEILHTPEAKSFLDVKEMAYRFCLSKDDALKRFPELEGKDVNWKAGKYATDDNDASDSEATGSNEKFLEGWEAYCIETKSIYWFAPQCYPTALLDKKPDEWGLRGFFPSPRFVIGSTPAKHLYPTPPFVQLAGTIKQLHVLYARIFDLIDGIKRRALVDGSCPELLKAFEELGNQEFITVENLGGLVEKAGGVSNLVWYLPVQELVQAIAELKDLDAFFNEKFDLHFGIPDILRGVTDPLATASAEQIASGAAHDRFKWVKAQITKLGSDALEMMVDLMLKVYSPQKIARICRVQYMTPTEQQLFPEALAILQNDEERLIRVEIQTDSMSFQNEQIENQNRNAVVQTVVGGLKEISGMLQAGQPQFAAVAMHGTLHALDGLSGGGDFIEEIKGYSEQLIDQAMNPPEQEPPPDYEAMKLSIEQSKVDLKAQDQQIQMGAKARELDQKDFKLQLEAQKQQSEAELRAYKIETDDKINQLFATIEGLRLKLDERKVDLSEKEMVLEESRLAYEAQANVENEPTERESAGQAPSVTIINAPGGI